jgi:hypothetical protein
MNPIAIILVIGAIVILVLNVFACYRVIGSEQLETSQKTLQCILIRFIPLLAAGLCIALTRKPRPGPLERRSSSEAMMDPLAVDPTSIGLGAGDYFID